MPVATCGLDPGFHRQGPQRREGVLEMCRHGPGCMTSTGRGASQGWAQRRPPPDRCSPYIFRILGDGEWGPENPAPPGPESCPQHRRGRPAGHWASLLSSLGSQDGVCPHQNIVSAGDGHGLSASERDVGIHPGRLDSVLPRHPSGSHL